MIDFDYSREAIKEKYTGKEVRLGKEFNMARSVFYSFHYQNDISRVMAVRNRWVTYGNQVASGIIDHADFEKVQRQGDAAIKRWIDSQLSTLVSGTIKFL